MGSLGVRVCGWHKYGYCKAGYECRDLHLTRVCEEEGCGGRGCYRRHPAPCRYWSTPEGCRRGSSCLYSHREARARGLLALPEELLLNILSLLAQEDLCSLATVSQHCHRLSTDPSLWADFHMKVSDSSYHNLRRVLESPRLARSKYLELDLNENKITNLDMINIMQRNLDCLQVWQTDFSQVSSTLLAMTLLQLQQTDLYHFNPDVLFPLMDQGPTRLTYLPILELELIGVDPDTFARACVKLETVELSNLCEQGRHVSALLGLLAAGQTRVRKLLTAGTDLGEVEVEPEVLARAVIGLEVATLDSLSSPQVEALFRIPTQGSRLREVAFYASDFSTISPRLFSGRLANLVSLDFQYNTTITKDHIVALLTAKHSSVRNLVLANSVDLSGIPPKLLAEKLALLSKVELNGKNKLTSEQVVELFRVLDTKKASPLEHLSLWGTDLSSVPAAVLGRVANSLLWVNLSDSSLSCCQLRHILWVTKTKIQVLNLKGTRAKCLPDHVLEQAENNTRHFAYRDSHHGHYFGRGSSDFSSVKLHDFIANYSS